MLLSIPSTPRSHDARLILADQLIATKLDRASGSAAAPIASTVAGADALLADFAGALPCPALPCRVAPSSSAGAAGIDDGRLLDAYNSGLDTPACTPR